MTKFKKSAFAFGAACALCLSGGLVALKATPAVADGGRTVRGYYGAKLAGNASYAIATAFYDELVAMAVDPDGDGEGKSELEQGAAHTVTSQAILAEAANYETGSDVLGKQFGAALDSFRFDYAELYYVDFDLLTFNVNKTVAGGEGPEEPDGGEQGGGGTEGEGSEETEPVALSGEPTYSVTIGAGRAATYFMKGITAEELAAKTELYKTNYNAIFASAKTALGNPANFAGISAAAKANAVNRAICEEVKFGYESGESGKAEFVSTVYGAAVNKFADSEGFARLFKAMMNDFGAECELVSGYYLAGGATASRVWNYVQEGSEWYAVDVAGNLLNKKTAEADGASETRYNQYLFLSEELFGLEHYEDAVISASRYKMPYPELALKNYNVPSGNLKIEKGTYTYTVTVEGTPEETTAEGETDSESTEPEPTEPSEPTTPSEPETEEKTRDAVVVYYNGEDTAVTLALRTLNGDLWGAWIAFDQYKTQFGAGVNGLTEADCKIATDEESGKTYLFGLTEGKFQIGVFEGNNLNKLLEYGEEIAEPTEGSESVAPVKIKSATPDGLRLKKWNIKETQTISIVYEEGLTKSDENAEVGVEFKIYSPFGYEVNENGVKAGCKVEEVNWSQATNTLSFKFTPSTLLRFNALRYEFVPKNLSKSGVLPEACGVTFSYNSIVANRVFGGNNGFYTGNFTQPALVNNGSAFAANVRNQLALVTTKPVEEDQTAIDNAVTGYITANRNLKYNYQEGAFKSSESYEINLTANGQKAAPNSYVKLAFPYPEGYGPETQNVVYQVFHFKRNAEGVVDYNSPEVLDPVKTRQGLVVAVNEFASFTVVALNSAKFQPPSDVTMYKTVLTQSSGVGGKITANTNKPVNVLGKTGDEIVYTLTAEIGYKLDFLTLNGNDQTKGSTFRIISEGDDTKPAVYEFKIIYGLLIGESSRPSPNNVLYAEFVAAGAAGTTDAAKGFAGHFVSSQLSTTAYTEDEKNEIVKDFPSGGALGTQDPGTIDPPIDETLGTKSTQMQLIIVLGVLIAFSVIGIIVIIFCAVIRPKIIREREEEAARIAANRERRANRNRMQSMGALPRGPSDPNNPNNRINK